MKELNKFNINEIRYIGCETSFNIWNTKYSELKIPEKSKHLFLIKKFQPSRRILDYYYSKVKYSLQYNGLKEFQEKFDFIHLDTLFNPYSIVINGVFWDKICLCEILDRFEYEFYLVNNKKVNLFETLTPLFESYAEGFLHGHNEFENENVNPYLNSFSDKQDFYKLIFEFINGNSGYSIVPYPNWFTTHGLSCDTQKNVNFNSGHKVGLNSGYLYKAWSIVFSNEKYFIEYFKQQQNIKPPEQSEKPKPEQKETELSEKVKKHFGFMLGNCPRKGKPILNNEKDFDNLVNWTTYFFENNFKVPEISNPIKSVNTNIHFTQLAFLYLFDELRKLEYHTQRTRAKTLFNLWESCFAEYKGYSDKNFWKVKHENGKEVKKLMLID